MEVKMFELLKKNLFTAIGMAVMTREKVEEVGKRIVQEAKLSEIEGKQFVEELIKKTDDARMAIEKIVNDKLEVAIRKLSIPTRSEIDNINVRLNKIEKNNQNGKHEC
jgi:polyhydroxyalkanoate synthesis regulator phasin